MPAHRRVVHVQRRKTDKGVIYEWDHDCTNDGPADCVENCILAVRTGNPVFHVASVWKDIAGAPIPWTARCAISRLDARRGTAKNVRDLARHAPKVGMRVVVVKAKGSVSH